jgi:hypothetical protein
MIPKRVIALGLLALIAFVSITVSSPFASAQSGTTQRGIITSDTVWTKASSPYNLTGPIAIQQGVKLTVEQGVTINLNSYYIQVNGTLSAVGTDEEPIRINGGSAINLDYALIPSGPASITFYSTSAGSQVQHVVFGGNQINAKSNIQITDSENFSLLISADPLITGNTKCSVTVFSGKPTISNNNMTAEIDVYGGSPQIINNQIHCNGGRWGIALGVRYALERTDAPYVSGNTITGSFAQGIISSGNATITHNLIVADPSDYPRPTGISIGGNATVQYNTIVKCATGFDIEKAGTYKINNNNIQNAARYFVRNTSPSNVNAANNWWGTTNQSAIAESIYDNKNDFNLGIVNTQPILTAPEQNAPAAPTPAPTANPSPTIPEFPATAALVIMLVSTVAAVVTIKKKQN